MGAIPVGRSILGYEKLLLSGIPADKLLLGTESEVQLSDLAGNAMVMPVVSAAILLEASGHKYRMRPFSLNDLRLMGTSPPKLDLRNAQGLTAKP